MGGCTQKQNGSFKVICFVPCFLGCSRKKVQPSNEASKTQVCTAERNRIPLRASGGMAGLGMKITLSGSVLLSAFCISIVPTWLQAQQHPELNDKLLPEDPRSPKTGPPMTQRTTPSANKPPADAEPPVVDSGPPGGPPSDAIVLFDGQDLSQWKSLSGGEAKWKLDDGTMQVNGTGNIVTKEQFGAIQLHVEWASPSEVKGEGQGRGNSGVYLQGRYEIQVLDSYQNKTYANGQAAALYGVAAPLVNACRKPGEWQTYDIIYHPPMQLPDAKMEAGSVTVLHNGVLVQDHVAVTGQSTTAAAFQGVVATGPLMLQDHGNPVRYRNIWLRRL